MSQTCRTHSYRCQYSCLFTKSSITSQPTSQVEFRDLKWPGCSSSAQAYSATLTTGSPSPLELLLARYARSQQKLSTVHQHRKLKTETAKLHLLKKPYFQIDWYLLKCRTICIESLFESPCGLHSYKWSRYISFNLAFTDLIIFQSPT